MFLQRSLFKGGKSRQVGRDLHVAVLNGRLHTQVGGGWRERRSSGAAQRSAFALARWSRDQDCRPRRARGGATGRRRPPRVAASRAARLARRAAASRGGPLQRPIVASVLRWPVQRSCVRLSVLRQRLPRWVVLLRQRRWLLHRHIEVPLL